MYKCIHMYKCVNKCSYKTLLQYKFTYDKLNIFHMEIRQNA